MTAARIAFTGLLAALVILAVACGSGTAVNLPYLYRVPVVTNSITLSVSASGTSYNTTQVTVGATTASLKPLYNTIYDFNTNTNQGWSSVMTLLGGGFTFGPDFSSGTLYYQSDANSWHGIANLTSPLLSDYIMVSEFTPVVVDSLSLIAQGMRVQSNLSDHYLMGMWSGTVYVSKYTGGTISTLNAATGFTMTAGTTYMNKTYAVGNALKIKIWKQNTAEPATWTVQATDSTWASGYPGLNMCCNQNAYFDNIRIGSSTYVNDFVMTNPTFTYATATLSQRTIASVSATVTAGSTDAIAFDVSLDGGSTYLTWNGSAWVTNSSGYTGAVSLSALSSHVSSLTPSNTFLLRAYLHSTYGYSTPSVTDVTLNLQ